MGQQGPAASRDAGSLGHFPGGQRKALDLRPNTAETDVERTDASSAKG